jgi:hypothetical protein
VTVFIRIRELRVLRDEWAYLEKEIIEEGRLKEISNV